MHPITKKKCYQIEQQIDMRGKSFYDQRVLGRDKNKILSDLGEIKYVTEKTKELILTLYNFTSKTSA